MKPPFKLEEITRSKQQFEYTLTDRLTLALVLVRPMDAAIRVRVRLASRGASATIFGFVMGRGDQSISMHTEQIHEAPETRSNLLVKAALYDEASFAYDGIIRVARRAQKSDAYQRNENLLLSPRARVRSDPALEILANDVRCTHGATTSAVNEDQLWYLMSRALPRSLAVRVLVEGFFQSTIGSVSDTIQQEKIRKVLWQMTEKE